MTSRPSISKVAIYRRGIRTNKMSYYHFWTRRMDGWLSSLSGSRLTSRMVLARRTGSSLRRNMYDVFSHAFSLPATQWGQHLGQRSRVSLCTEILQPDQMHSPDTSFDIRDGKKGYEMMISREPEMCCRCVVRVMWSKVWPSKDRPVLTLVRGAPILATLEPLNSPSVIFTYSTGQQGLFFFQTEMATLFPSTSRFGDIF